MPKIGCAKSLNPEMEISYKSYRGAEIAEVFEPLARLRIAVFRDWPYLYEGSLDYEMDYLKTYSEAPNSLLHAAFYRGEMVGATTCIPLADETGDVQKPFLEAGMRVEEIFYFGESILLPEYRGQGIGNVFFNAREAHAASFGTYRVTCFCGVQRPLDHPLRPLDYRPLDEFWMKRGYRKVPELSTTFSWPDIGESESTAKPMVFWMREL
ncbi:MAG: GNAT family N-acetyltransferase [Bacteroidia bacterium]